MARARKKEKRVVKPKIYIFCEGEKTEPAYIRAYINFKYPNSARLRDAERPVIIEKTKKNTPVQLVEVALQHKKGLDFDKDQVWVVYDRESPQKYPDELHKKAYDDAKCNGVYVVISNICFEYWLLLHLSNSTIAVSNCDSLIKSPVFAAAFRSLGISNYDKKGKTAKDLSELLMRDDYLSTARSNAEKNNENAMKSSPAKKDEPYKIQPYTNMHELLAAIDQIAT